MIMAPLQGFSTKKKFKKEFSSAQAWLKELQEGSGSEEEMADVLDATNATVNQMSKNSVFGQSKTANTKLGSNFEYNVLDSTNKQTSKQE